MTYDSPSSAKDALLDRDRRSADLDEICDARDVTIVTALCHRTEKDLPEVGYIQPMNQAKEKDGAAMNRLEQNKIDELLEMHESIQSMISFTELSGDEGGLKESSTEAENLGESMQSNLSFSHSDSAKEDYEQDGSNDKTDDKNRIPHQSTTKTISSTLATDATSKSSVDPARMSARAGEDDQQGNDFAASGDDFPADDVDSGSRLVIMTPTERQSARRFSGSMACRSCVPQHLIHEAARSVIISPLSADDDPSPPGHNMKIISQQAEQRQQQSRRSSGSAFRNPIPQYLRETRSEMIISPLSADPSPGHKTIISLDTKLLRRRLKKGNSLSETLPESTPGRQTCDHGKMIGKHEQRQIRQKALSHIMLVDQHQEGRGAGCCRAPYFIPGITAEGRMSMNSIHSRDFIPETPAPLRSSGPELSWFRVGCAGDEEDGGNEDTSSCHRFSVSDHSLSIPPSPIDPQCRSGSPGVQSCSTVSSRRLQRLPRTSLNGSRLNSTDDESQNAAEITGHTTTRSVFTSSSSSTKEDGNLDSRPNNDAASNSFAHLEERPPTPVKRRQRLRSRKTAFAASINKHNQGDPPIGGTSSSHQSPDPQLL